MFTVLNTDCNKILVVAFFSSNKFQSKLVLSTNVQNYKIYKVGTGPENHVDKNVPCHLPVKMFRSFAKYTKPSAH